MDQLLIKEIQNIAARYAGIKKIVLFGSRARGDNADRSDIDLCIYSAADISAFEADLNEEADTLLTFDVTRMRPGLDPEFVRHVEQEGIILYEKS